MAVDRAPSGDPEDFLRGDMEDIPIGDGAVAAGRGSEALRESGDSSRIRQGQGGQNWGQSQGQGFVGDLSYGEGDLGVEGDVRLTEDAEPPFQAGDMGYGSRTSHGDGGEVPYGGVTYSGGNSVDGAAGEYEEATERRSEGSVRTRRSEGSTGSPHSIGIDRPRLPSPDQDANDTAQEPHCLSEREEARDLSRPGDAGAHAGVPSPPGDAGDVGTAPEEPPTVEAVWGSEAPSAVGPETPSATATAAPPRTTRTHSSKLQQVISFTRQRDLPPKSKEEERKHLRELDEMRRASQEAERAKREEAARRERARQAALARALPEWETRIVPRWEAAAEAADLRKLWWDGTMPLKHRGRLWTQAIGNGLSLGRNVYFKVEAYVVKLEDEGRYPATVAAAIADDAARTMPQLHLFHRGGAMHQDLVDVLKTYSIYWTREPKFYADLSYPAALLLINMPKAEAFLSLVNLVHKSFLGSFYHGRTLEMDAYYRIFETLLADAMPSVYTNFCQEDVRPALYLQPWIRTCFARFVSLDAATRIFDVFVLEGDAFIFRVALALLQILEPRLFNPEISALEDVFRGTDRGSVVIVRREKAAVAAGTAAAQAAVEASEIFPEEVYTEMGCTEHAIFDQLEHADWKEEKWTRLVERELPDV